MKPITLSTVVVATLLSACGGGGSTGDPATVPDADASTGTGSPQGPVVAPETTFDDSDEPVLDPAATRAGYRVTLENLWGAETYPQEFPDDAHLSLVGGALHDDSVSFWAVGTPLSRGMEDIAETGMIDVFLYDEVVPAIEAGSAASFVEYLTYTGPMVDGQPGVSEFEIEAQVEWPLLTLATMLGPSPDWFVGVSALALDGADGWQERIVVDLPLLDGGSKSDIIPVMGGPDIIPSEPVGHVVYDAATGTYLPSAVPEIVSRLTLQRIR